MDINGFKVNEKRKKIGNTLDNFMERNRSYSIKVYLISTATDVIVGSFYVPVERNYDQDREVRYNLSWNNSTNSLYIPYDEVITSYEETDKYGSQTVSVVTKCGIIIEFECCGERL